MQIIVLFLLLIILFNCKDKPPKDHTFYYWKTNLVLNNEEKSALQNAKVPILYTRFFDVDKIAGKFQPVGVIIKDATFTYLR